MLGRFLESGNVHVADAGTNQEMEIDAVAGNLIARDVEFQRLRRTFAQNGDLDVGTFRSFEEIGNIGSAHVVGGLSVDGDNHVARMNSGAIGRSSHERGNDDDFVIARSDLHSHAVVLSTLLFPKQGVGLGIKEIGVRIEHAEHARNGTVVDGLVGAHRFGVVLLYQVINLRECAQAVTDFAIARGRATADALAEKSSEKTTGKNDENYQEESTASTTDHLLISLVGCRNPHPQSKSSIARQNGPTLRIYWPSGYLSVRANCPICGARSCVLRA